MNIRLTVTRVEQRLRTISVNSEGGSHTEKFWCIVLQPGHIALDFGDQEPQAKVGDKMLLVREP